MQKTLAAHVSWNDRARCQSMLDVIMLALTLILANLRATMLVFFLVRVAWVEIFLWLLVFVGVLWILKRDGWLAAYLHAWWKNWLLVVFVLLALLSMFWSIGFTVSLFRALELLFATLIAAYIGIRYRPADLAGMLFWFGAIMLILSTALILLVPNVGVMEGAPFYGAWRGMYWHRNHLGSITALISTVLFIRFILASQHRKSEGILDGIFYLLSLLVLYATKSATGYILFILLHFCVLCYVLWLKNFHRLQKRHYFVIVAIFIAGLIAILLNLEFIFGLFNRDITLTGRVRLWDFLLEEIIPQRVWLGYGFGAIWTFKSFRLWAQQQIGWGSQPLIADNGFFDILLHLGAVGLLIFTGVLITALIRSLRHAIYHKALIDFLPLLIMIYALVANIPFSLFAETEVFVWILLTAVLFMTLPEGAPASNPTIT
ncbi:MAG TPA: O-antigen ligase family protein [Anaerolineales bacterium]|nr:O-antigen ligase family protein [Anaerolineales bacterium]